MSENASKAFGTPLHRQVFLVLKDDILAGKYTSSEPLPGEPTLARMFDVSRITIRRALADLEAAQMIDRRPGRGTFVRARPPKPATELGSSGLGLEMAQIGQLPAKLLEFEMVIPPPEVVEALGLAPGALAQRSVRVRSQATAPVVHLTTFVSEELGNSYTRQELAESSFFGLLKRAGHPFVRSFQNIYAALAEPGIAQALSLDVGSPILSIHRTYFDQDNRPVAFLILRASSAHYQIDMELPIGEGEPDPARAAMTYRVKMLA